MAIAGTDASETINGTSGNDSINALGGDDTINPSIGIDTVDGGSGNDLLIVNYSSITYGEISTTFNSSDRTSGYLKANNSSNSYYQVTFSNVERFNITGTANNDYLYGAALNDNLSGGGGNDTLDGAAGNDILNGGIGNDNLIGGDGNDTYVVDSIADTITETSTGGTDIVQASITWNLGANLENITLTGSAVINGTGNELNNIITGNTANNTLSGGSGNDTLNGGVGNDNLIGGLGNDTYIVDSNTDIVTEAANEGIDTVQSAINWILGANLENLTLTGSAAINGTGNELNNIIRGNSANNIINGGAGSDNLIGGLGNDIYIVDLSSDIVTEAANQGTDTVDSAISWILAANLENLTLTGSAAINGTGNGLNNIITGNSGNNTLTGGAGNDNINGDAGNDIIYGSSGGSVGEIDTLSGGAGVDKFILATDTQVFYDDGNTGTDGTSNYALITDFNSAEDFIQLQNPKTDYILTSSPTNLPTGTAIYRNKPNTEPDELIGIIQGSSNLSIDGSYFNFVNPSILQFSTSNYSVKEYGTVVTAVTITRTGSSKGVASATVTPGNGSAIAPNDYNSNPIVVNFADGDTTAKTVVIPIVDDVLVEGNETINLSLTNPSGSAIIGAQNTAVLSILDNDVSTSETHPRLYVDATRISQIKAAIQVAGSHHQQAFNAMKARVDQNNWRVYDDDPNDTVWNSARSHMAREAAFMYLLTNDSKYAQISYNALYDIYNNVDPSNRLPSSGDGIGRATVGRNFALAYDWAYNGWTQDQRNYIKGKLDLSLDSWVTYSHANLNDPTKASNWVAVCRGAELVMMLAAREEQTRSSRYSDLKNWLNLNLQNGYGNLGVTQEGIGYSNFGGTYLVPAVYALRSVGDTSLDASFNSKAFWQQAMYAGSFAMNPYGERDFLQSGVSSGAYLSYYDEGWASLLLGSVPQDQLPYYRYFYDRHTGIYAPGTPAEKFDEDHGGTVWSLIYYPENGTSVNPTGIFSQAVSDEDRGAYFFRNHWQDANDVLVSIMADTVNHSHAWDQSEAFNLGLIAYNTHFIGGPGKEDISTSNPGVFSGLLVDGEAQLNQKTTGTKEFFSSNPDGGGYVIVDGGQKYSSLGLSSAKRHFLVDFSTNTGTTILSTLDRIQDESNHSYTWQLNVGDDVSNAGVSVSSGSEGGLSTFLLSGKNSSYLKGWVMYPTNASIAAGDPLKVITSGANADIWVAMVLGTGTPLQGTVTGTGLNAVLQVGGDRIRYDATSNRIISEAIAASAPNLAATEYNNTNSSNLANNVFSDSNFNDTLIGSAGSDMIIDGLGNDSDIANVVNNIVQQAGGDSINRFIRGASGERREFTNIANNDVVSSGSTTAWRLSDGISENPGFGSGALLGTTSSTAGFTGSNIDLNLASSNTGKFFFA